MDNNSKVLVLFSSPSEYLGEIIKKCERELLVSCWPIMLYTIFYYYYYHYLKLTYFLKFLLDQNLIMIYLKSNKILKVILFVGDKRKIWVCLVSSCEIFI
jgi:hypothetical protein